MSGKIPFSLVVFLSLVQMAAADGPAAPAAGTGALLLRNGQVIEGHIARNGDYYTVTAPDQEMQIRVSSVQFLCRDIRDGYERKKAAISQDDIQQHLELLVWCEQHKLFDLARQELAAAEAIDRNHEMIPVLRRRLTIESQPVVARVRPAEKVDSPPTDEVLDHMVRGMPPGTVELFVQVVQPILLNHYPGARGFALPDNKHLYLMRPAQGETPGRRITQRNLYAVLQCIDSTDPAESPLLKATCGSPSGTAASGFPAKFSPQYQKLTQWAYMVAQKLPPDDGAAGASFAELAGGELSAPRPRPATHIPYAPASTGHDKDGKDLSDTKDRSDTKDIRNIKASAQDEPRSKPKTAASQAEDAHVPHRTLANRAVAQAIDSLDPYDPATFNNQADAPTSLPTPASRVLHGDGQP